METSIQRAALLRAAILECKLHSLPHSQSQAMYNSMEMIDAVERRHGRRPTCSLGSSAALARHHIQHQFNGVVAVRRRLHHHGAGCCCSSSTMQIGRDALAELRRLSDGTEIQRTLIANARSPRRTPTVALPQCALMKTERNPTSKSKSLVQFCYNTQS